MSDRVIGYCTNVHAGATLAQTKANLENYALRVKAKVCPHEPLGVGLWLSARAARELVQHDGSLEFAQWLREAGLNVFTFNGFPYGDFHQHVVKHQVYRPDWRQPERLDYTIDLIDILEAIVPPDGEGSISTLPLGWGAWFTSDSDLSVAAANLQKVARYLAALEQRTGKLIHVDLEPEPGCCLSRSQDVVAFFVNHLLTGKHDELVRRHLRICHDICHAAVMFEDQAEVFSRYDSIGVQVGKVHVSCAVRARFDSLGAAHRRRAFEQLGRFHEERYLHQTVVRQANEPHPRFFEDLSDALASVRNAEADAASGEWRTHFHVPIFLDHFGLLEATGDEVESCVNLVHGRLVPRHFEVETYTWDVLPADLKHDSLAANIARELSWFSTVWSAQDAS